MGRSKVVCVYTCICVCVCVTVHPHLPTSYCCQLGEFALKVLEVFVGQTFGILQLQLRRPVGATRHKFPQSLVNIDSCTLDLYTDCAWITIRHVGQLPWSVKSHSFASREICSIFLISFQSCGLMWAHVDKI